MVRTLSEHVRERYGASIDPQSALMAWAIRHAAWLITRFQVHPTGKTAFQSVRLRGYNGEIVQFAESVWGRDPSEAAGEFKADSRWTKGIWLGKVETSDEHIVGRGASIVMVRVVRRCPEEERWDAPLLRDLVAPPWTEATEQM